ncbi:YczE/YyaS/YitT family protein [Miniphocaeibacter massiliensis]|uniref:YczE/YyaS/YitT family protein n=1 Tax=Miniphocaeibacter massiliensis TaxID=2041841 RepID=UPI000C1BCC08|nr:DUF6198 family protein [Miniphocaeibacter massiliensis]
MKDIKSKKFFPSELALIIGILLNGFAIVIYIKSNFGVSTISSIPFIVNKVIPSISLGNTTILYEVLLITILVLLTGIKKKYIYSILLGLLFGVIIDFYSWLLSFTSIGEINSIVLYIIAFTSLSFGISLCLKSDLTALPFDIFVKVISDKSNKSIKFVKTVFDITSVLIASAISLMYFKSIEGVAIGTVVSMLFTGNMIQVFSNIIDKYFSFTSIYKNKFNKSYEN